MKGLEPSTFCMASRRSSQLSYIRGSLGSIANLPAGSQVPRTRARGAPASPRNGSVGPADAEIQVTVAAPHRARGPTTIQGECRCVICG